MQTITTREQAKDRLKRLQGAGNPVASASEADEIICAFLVSLGFADVVDEYKLVDQWDV